MCVDVCLALEVFACCTSKHRGILLLLCRRGWSSLVSSTASGVHYCLALVHVSSKCIVLVRFVKLHGRAAHMHHQDVWDYGSA